MIPGSMYKKSALYAPGNAGKSDILVVVTESAKVTSESGIGAHGPKL